MAPGEGSEGVVLDPVNPPELARPSGFSHAIVASPGGRLVFLAGQTALDASGAIVGDDVVAQFEQALRNLLAALRAAGGRPADLASLTIYATDLADYRAHGRELGQVWQRLAGPRYPAIAALGVSRLWDTAALVEIQGIAALP
jgi:enamine deaminase RidA (YjgF/YER057c/UK114 family)